MAVASLVTVALAVQESVAPAAMPFVGPQAGEASIQSPQRERTVRRSVKGAASVV